MFALPLVLSVTCGRPRPSDEDWRSSERSLWITIESVPKDARIYGVRDGEPGTLLGEAPITLKFWKARVASKRVFWQSPVPEARVYEVLVYHYSAMLAQAYTGPGLKDRRPGDTIDRQYPKYRRYRSGMQISEKADFRFFVVKDGFQPHLLEFTIEDKFPSVFTGDRRYSVKLKPIAEDQ
ncbi:MAG: hypothetical protein JSW34_03160 [Candidatus Zixiibacteriota bacterium]|nr:MAG: hypothetical protein JSW34_03160 [candidate division Zixibacteria bacterium]